jgi:hypothetical protein
MMETLAMYLAVILTFCVWSYLWKENIAFRIAEHIYVGLAASYSVVNNWHNYLKPTIQNDILTDGRYGYLLLMLLGLLMYTRYNRRWLWLSRIPIALEVGYGIGYGLAIGPRTYLRNVNASFINIIQKDGAGNIIFSQSLNQFLFFISIVTVLSYFIFTRPQEGLLKVSANTGRWIMMITFGASFGNTITTRISTAIGRLQFLLGDWLKLF